MHPYAIDTNERQYVFFFLAVVSVGIAWLSNWVLTNLQVTIPWYGEAPSVLTAYGLLVWSFDKYAWRWRFIRLLRLVRTPDLSGDWEGHIESSFHNYERKQHVKVTIEQTWTKICIALDTGSTGSQSHSETAGILIEYPGRPVLTYNYLNEPRAVSTETMHTHRGTAILSVRGDHLDGQYYSGRGRTNHGSIELRRVRTS